MCAFVSYLAVFCAAQRFFCAAAIRALASALIVRVFGSSVALGRPGPRFTSEAGMVERIARACCSFAISESMAEMISEVCISAFFHRCELHSPYVRLY